ncbi:hypothetical protein D3C75_662200 [compost metagenome]
MPSAPFTVPYTNTVGLVFPGAFLPNANSSARLTAVTLVKVVPESPDRYRPWVSKLAHTSPLMPGAV